MSGKDFLMAAVTLPIPTLIIYLKIKFWLEDRRKKRDQRIFESAAVKPWPAQRKLVNK